MKTIERIFDVTTGETTDFERELTAQEIAEYETEQAAAAAEAEAQAAKEAAKQAVLKKLGLTADEVKALLG
jgi:phosphopantetheinyl transferase (holo-ACP synthase)